MEARTCNHTPMIDGTSQSPVQSIGKHDATEHVIMRQHLTQRSAAPEVHPVLANIEGALPDCVSHILLDEFRAIALDKVKAPALKADSVLEPVEPISERAPEALVQMVQICTQGIPSALPLCIALLCAGNSMPSSLGHLASRKGQLCLGEPIATRWFSAFNQYSSLQDDPFRSCYIVRCVT